MSLFSPIEHCISNIITDVEEPRNSPDEFDHAGQVITTNAEKAKITQQFQEFNKLIGQDSQLWRYWNIFLNESMPAVCHQRNIIISTCKLGTSYITNLRSLSLIKIKYYSHWLTLLVVMGRRGGWQKCPTPIIFYVSSKPLAQSSWNFLVRNVLSVSVKKIKNLKILFFINSTGHTQFAIGCD